MSITSIMGRRDKRSAARERTEPPPYPPRAPAVQPRPQVPPGPHQLGSVTLQAVDQLTGMSAEEIEKVADDLIEAAHVTALELRATADRIREHGIAANERLANFVRVATTCADAARMMSDSVQRRDEPMPAETPKLAAAEPHDAGEHAVDMDSLAEQVEHD